MSMHNLGIPDLPMMAFQRDARGLIRPQGGGKGKTPKQPDYVAAAEAEAQGNLALAREAAQANRVNQVTPWGSLTWTNDRQFDQAGYDSAMQAYQQGLGSTQGAAASQPGFGQQYGINPRTGQLSLVSYSNPMGSGESDAGNENYAIYEPVGGIPGMQSSQAPNRDDFYSGGDNWSQTVTLSPEMQAQLDQQNRLQQGLFGAQNSALDRVNQTMGSGLDTSRLSSIGSMGDVLNLSLLPGMGTALDINSLPEMAAAFQASGQALDTYDPDLATNNATELMMQRINPQLDQQQEALRAQLANQGIVQGTQAYDRAMMQHQQGRNDAYNQAALTGIGLGMQQQGMMFDQGLSNRGLLASEHDLMYGHQQGLRHGEAGLQNQQFTQKQNLRTTEAQLQAQRFAQQTQNYQQSVARRERDLAEQAYLRNLPMQELGALTGGSQVSMPQFPGYAQQATTGGPQLLNAAQSSYQSSLGAANAQNAAASNTMSGILGLGGLGVAAYSAGLFSDRRLKRNIKRVGTADNGLGIYTYQYVWGGPTQMGVMADEAERIAPHAVGNVGGYQTVDYGAL